MNAVSEAYDVLKLENQVCFPLYACAKEVVRRYRPYLDRLSLTYTQYITMMALWECAPLSVKELGERLYLDTGTLTPLLKTMEQKGLIVRTRSEQDERSVIISLTEKGLALREQALDVPEKVGSCIHLPPEKAQQLYALLYELIDSTKE